MNMGSDTLAMAPEISLFAGAVIALLAGSFTPRTRQWIPRLLTVASLLACVITAAFSLAGPPRRVFADSFAVDTTSGVAALIVAGATLLVIGLGVDELRDTQRESEAYVLLLLAGLGTLLLAGAADLLVLVIGFLLASIPLYALIGLTRTPAAAEATLKTYLLGALFGLGLLLGVTVLYGAGGATTYLDLAQAVPGAPDAVVIVGVVAVLGALLFKAGAVPAHFWVPDAAQGASTWAAAYATTVPKIGGLLAIYRFFDEVDPDVNWRLLLAVLAVATMTIGNLAAFAQNDPRRLLGWSTVSQAGYMLLPVCVAGASDLALPSLLLYLAGYAVTNIAAFAVIAAVPERQSLADYHGLIRRRPWLAGALAVSLLSLAGTPPTAVFIGKLTTFAAAWDGGYTWLTIVAAINSVASLFYYLRWLAPAFGHDPGARSQTAGHAGILRSGLYTAYSAASGIIAFGVGSGAVWALVNR